MLPILSIVVPCYNEVEVLPETTRYLSEELITLIKKQIVSSRSFIIYINDGSNDNTWNLIKKYYKTNPYVCGINLAKNVGHQNALMAGLSVAKEKSDITITIDADLQDDVKVIREMIKNYKEGFDIVYGVRKSRKTDTFFKRTTALTFYKLMNFLGVNTVYNHADYRLMSRRSLDFLFQFKEKNLFLRGLVPLIGYNTTSVYYDRAERIAGESKYPLNKMLNFAIDGITSFSVKPVRMILWLGLIFIIICFLVFLYTIYSYFYLEVVSGWTSMILSVWFCTGFILVALGIIGEYIGKIYIEVKDRPRYNIESILLHSDTTIELIEN